MLGDEAESLRLARQQLDEAIRQVNDEAARADDAGREGPSTSRRQGAGEAEDPNGAGQPGSPREGVRPQDADLRTARAGGRGQSDPAGFGGGQDQSGQWDDIGTRGPLTGEDYREWSDNLRDVEEMLTERDLREEVARVRDRAKGMRAEFVRHGKEPQWELVRSQIMDPLTELKQQISERLAQLQSDDALVPIDRDPVPDRFAEVVRKYFENLGDNE